MTPPPAPVTPVVLIGGVAPLGPGGPMSGIDKRAALGPWRITRDGLVGDAQGDLKHHGGPEKALHHYPRDHYPLWAAEIGAHPLLARPGAFGENLSSAGWTEETVHIGDVARFGSALLQAAQGRQPCFKLDLRFGRRGMAREVQRTGRTGWYWRVLEEGAADAGDALALIDRPQPDWPISRLVRLLHHDAENYDDLAAMARLPELAETWRALAARRVARRRVEDWSSRLDGAPR